RLLPPSPAPAAAPRSRAGAGRNALNPSSARVPMHRTVVIDFLPESARRYGPGWVVVAVDVIRATTTAVTAAAAGRRCFPVPSIEAALPVAAALPRPLLCGELGGNMPYGFDLTNSPAAVAARSDPERPLILLS